MDILELVALCLETLKAGPYPGMQIVEINWSHWHQDRTSEIRCVFWPNSDGTVCVDIYPSLSRTHGSIVNPRTTWKLADEVLLREKVDNSERGKDGR